jgi:O-antigen ligase
MSGRRLPTLLPPAPWAALACIVAVIVVAQPTLRAPILTIICIGLSFYRLDLAMLLWMACAALAPQALIQVRNAVIVPTTAVLSFLLVRWGWERVQRGDLRLPRSRLTVPLLAIALTAVASGVTGALFYDSAVPGVHRYLLVQVYAIALVVLSVATVFFVSEQIQGRRVLNAAVGMLVVIGITMTVNEIPPGRLLQMPRWYPIIITCAFTLVYASVLSRLPRTRWQWLAGLVALALVLQGPAKNFFFHESQWISGWVMIGIPLILLPLLCLPRLALPAIVIGGLLGLFLIWPRVEFAFEQARLEGDFHRLIIWKDALLMGSLRPVFGIGPGNYIDYAERYAQVDIALASAHGNYQQIVAEMGIVGLGFVLWALWRVLAVAWQVFRKATDPIDRVIGLATIGALAGQMGASVMGDYLFPAYHNGGHANISATIYTWMLIGVLMSAERRLRTGSLVMTPQPAADKKEGVVFPPPLRVNLS